MGGTDHHGFGFSGSSPPGKGKSCSPALLVLWHPWGGAAAGRKYVLTISVSRNLSNLPPASFNAC
jgi:hypothetical protein